MLMALWTLVTIYKDNLLIKGHFVFQVIVKLLLVKTLNIYLIILFAIVK